MRFARLTALAALLAIVPAASASTAETIPMKVGSVSYAVPVPDGFAPLPKEDPYFAAVEKAAPGNKLYALFIDAQAPGGPGIPPTAGRTCNIQLSRALINQPCSRISLEQAKKETIAEQASLATEATEAMKSAGLALNSVEARPVHEQGDRHFSYTMILHQNDRKMAAVTSIILLRARLIYCYVNSPMNSEEDVKWAESTAKAWVARLIAENPSDAAAAAIENRKPGLDLLTIGVLIAIAAILALTAWFLISRKNRIAATPAAS